MACVTGVTCGVLHRVCDMQVEDRVIAFVSL